MFKKVASIVVLVSMLAMTSCMGHMHTVGNGAQGGNKVEKTQWYFLFGLVPLNEVNTKQMADGATNYTIKSEMSVINYLITIVTQFATITSRTVTVTK